MILPKLGWYRQESYPQPTEGEQFGSLGPAPLGTPHGYERMAALQGRKLLSSGPSADEIALESHRLLKSSLRPFVWV